MDIFFCKNETNTEADLAEGCRGAQRSPQDDMQLLKFV